LNQYLLQPGLAVVGLVVPKGEFLVFGVNLNQQVSTVIGTGTVWAQIILCTWTASCVAPLLGSVLIAVVRALVWGLDTVGDKFVTVPIFFAIICIPFFGTAK
jgi:hypothetical protein